MPTTDEATGHAFPQGHHSAASLRQDLPPEIAKTYEAAIKKVDSDEFKEFMTRRGFDMIYLDAVKYGEFMKADDEDNAARR